MSSNSAIDPEDSEMRGAQAVDSQSCVATAGDAGQAHRQGVSDFLS